MKITKRELFRILIFILIPIPLLYLGTYIVDNGLQKSRNKYFDVWNDIKAGINADVIILGSSRAWVHISPRILDSVLYTNSYNLGLDNWCFPMQHCRLKVFLQHNRKPKAIIHSLDYHTFEKNRQLYDDVQFLPYFDDPTIMRATEGYIGSFNPLQRYFPMYKYRNNGAFILEGLINYFNSPAAGGEKYKGYQGMVKKWDSTFADFVHQNPNGYRVAIDKALVEEFDQYLDYCQKNNIEVILTYTPEYFRAQEVTINRKEMFAIFKYFAEKYQIPLLDYSDDPMCSSIKFFYNSQHLNKHGSEVFCQKLAKDLKPLISQALCKR